MDRLVIMDEGRIVEQGTHDELRARGGLYAGLWERQSGGFLAPEAIGRPSLPDAPPDRPVDRAQLAETVERPHPVSLVDRLRDQRQ